MVGRTASPQVGRLEFVLRHIGLGLHRDALGLAADSQFVDPGAAVLDPDPLDLLVPAGIGLLLVLHEWGGGLGANGCPGDKGEQEKATGTHGGIVGRRAGRAGRGKMPG